MPSGFQTDWGLRMAENRLGGGLNQTIIMDGSDLTSEKPKELGSIQDFEESMR